MPKIQTVLIAVENETDRIRLCGIFADNTRCGRRRTGGTRWRCLSRTPSAARAIILRRPPTIPAI